MSSKKEPAKPKKMDKITALEMEVALSQFFNYRTNLIIPNIHWSFFQHELDLCILSPAGYCTEIEIKVDKYDLIKDKEKPHGHRDKKIKYLYFAIPEYLKMYTEHIPERAGIIVVNMSGACFKHREAIPNSTKYKFSEKERVELMRLLCMRIWNLKRDLSKTRLNLKRLRDE